MSTSLARPVKPSLIFDSRPDNLFVVGDAIKEKVWDVFAPVWGPVTKFGCTSNFDDVTYKQMLEDLERRGLMVYMDNDHKTASLGWSVDEVPALAYYCSVIVARDGSQFGRVYLGGCRCSDAVPFDFRTNPTGMHGFRCRVTPEGKVKLPNYQALSIHFDPDSRDESDRSIGQTLTCISAVNGPHLPSAVPNGGKFSKDHPMPTRTYEAGGTAPASLTPTTEELRKLLQLPEGCDLEAIAGAAVAILRTMNPFGEPDGDEADEAEESEATKEAKLDAMPEEYRRKLRKVIGAMYVRRKLSVALAKELGGKGLRQGLVEAAKLRQASAQQSSHYAALQTRLDELERKAAQDAELAWEYSIKASINAAGPTNAAIFAGEVGGKALPKSGDGRISDVRGKELFELAKAAKLNAEQFAKILPEPMMGMLPQKTPSASPSSANSSSTMRNGDVTPVIDAFCERFAKDNNGKRLTYRAAARLLQSHFAKNGATAQLTDAQYSELRRTAASLGNESFL
mgnify:CR=1 FL=1